MHLVDCPICNKPFFGEEGLRKHFYTVARQEVYRYVIDRKEISKKEMLECCPHAGVENSKVN